MNVNQRDSALIISKEIYNIDIFKIAEQHYSGQDWNLVLINDVTINKICINTKRVVKQFIEELNGDEFKFYPVNYTNPDIIGPSNIVDQLSQLRSRLIENTSFDKLINNLAWLVSYQINFGFWQQSKKRVHSPKDIELKSKEAEIRSLSAELMEQKSILASLKKRFELSIEKLDLLHIEKEQNLAVITTQLTDTLQNASGINMKWQEAIETEGKIKAILESIKGLSDDQKITLKTLTDSLTDLEEKSKGYIKVQASETEDIKAKNLKFKERLEEILRERDYIDSKKLEIEALTGFAADSSLGHSFNKRATELKASTNMWLIIFLGLVLVSGGWIYLSFTELKAATGNPWTDFLMNAVKTIPVFVVLGFAAKRYTNERQLQEEYAFKKAVAVTITAYADQLKEEMIQDKRQLLLGTVERIYTPPKNSPESGWQLPSLRRKKDTEILDKLADILEKRIQ